MTDREPLDESESLWRRINPSHMKEDGGIISAAFSNVELSVDIARFQQDMLVTLKDATGEDGAGIAVFEAGAAQSLGLKTVADPLPENPAHALVIGKKTQRIKRTLRNASEFISREQILESEN